MRANDQLISSLQLFDIIHRVNTLLGQFCDYSLIVHQWPQGITATWNTGLPGDFHRPLNPGAKPGVLS